MSTIDKRPLVAVYSTCNTKRDKRAIELLRAFCVISELRCTFFLDKKMPKAEHPPAWGKLCEEISQGRYQVVLTWMDLDAALMEQWCAQFGATFQKVDIFEWFRAMRTKVDYVRLY
jgi:hypothetical protein